VDNRKLESMLYEKERDNNELLHVVGLNLNQIRRSGFETQTRHFKDAESQGNRTGQNREENRPTAHRFGAKGKAITFAQESGVVAQDELSENAEDLSEGYQDSNGAVWQLKKPSNAAGGEHKESWRNDSNGGSLSSTENRGNKNISNECRRPWEGQKARETNEGVDSKEVQNSSEYTLKKKEGSGRFGNFKGFAEEERDGEFENEGGKEDSISISDSVDLFKKVQGKEDEVQEGDGRDIDEEMGLLLLQQQATMLEKMLPQTKK
jgi:hypothetical protein